MDYNKTIIRRSDSENARIHGRSGHVVRAIELFNEGIGTKARAEKYAKMAASAYALYRGTNHLYWQDFELDWRLDRFGSYRTRTWLNGDCHAYNFGAFSAHRTGVVYGLNDFDESIVGDYQYDLWRLAISLVLIARDNQLSNSSTKKIIDSLAQTYLDTLHRFAGNRAADETCYTADNTYGRLKKFLRKTQKKDSRGKLLEKWTTQIDGASRFDVAIDKLDAVTEEDRVKIGDAIASYVQTIRGDRRFSKDFFRVVDIARRLDAGTGSLGTRRYYVLIEGDKESDNDDIILDVKQQGRPSAYPYANEEQLALYHDLWPNEGIRHQTACLALGYHPDDLLGWLELDGQAYSVRERSPYKESFPTEELSSTKRFVESAEQWGRCLATEHARADRISDYSLATEVSKLTAGKDSGLRRVVREVAFGYADQVEADWKSFLRELAPQTE